MAKSTSSALSPKAIEKLSFEEALQQLEEIVRGLENGKETLESAINGYTVGTELKLHCEKKLTEARLKIEQIVARKDGTLITEPVGSTE